MFKRTGIQKTLVTDSGSSVIGQTCEFDRSGGRAVRDDDLDVTSIHDYHGLKSGRG
ncbi:MAG TPA: hypothetical protein PK590_00590 [Candidatus Omnitrophota bacterium]|nr:hypothetical protein [Candidatus Omnitrophota bacterium]